MMKALAFAIGALLCAPTQAGFLSASAAQEFSAASPDADTQDAPLLPGEIPCLRPADSDFGMTPTSWSPIGGSGAAAATIASPAILPLPLTAWNSSRESLTLPVCWLELDTPPPKVSG